MGKKEILGGSLLVPLLDLPEILINLGYRSHATPTIIVMIVVVSNTLNVPVRGYGYSYIVKDQCYISQPGRWRYGGN
jgi:hypothetical protein